MQGHYAKVPGQQDGEDETFPKDQYYNPPEADPLSVKVLRESAEERVELREHRSTKIEVTLRGGKEVSRELVALRLNPWWYPHDLYSPKDSQSGGPFTIGRVIHSSRGVGFTGWIGGVAVFNRALDAAELQTLTALARARPLERDAVEARLAVARRAEREPMLSLGHLDAVHGVLDGRALRGAVRGD
jgi:hypothetical protein